jgi:hypothetical protein
MPHAIRLASATQACYALAIIFVNRSKTMNLEQIVSLLGKKGWEVEALANKALEEALSGDAALIDQLCAEYPLCGVNADYSLFVYLKRYHVQIWGDERRILNCAPGEFAGQPSDDVQWRLCTWGSKHVKPVVKDGYLFEDGYLPPYDYKKVSVNEKDEIIITAVEKVTTTNVEEIRHKLIFKDTKPDKREIEDRFNALCNETFAPEVPPKKIQVVHKTLKSEVMGVMKYDKELEWYAASAQIEGLSVSVYINLAEPDDLLKIAANADKLMKDRFYEQAMEAMIAPMLELKNDYWLGEDDDGNNEEPLSAEAFKERVKLSSICFYEDGSAEIDYLDDDMFYGHTIVIETDKNGVFVAAKIEG